VQAALDSLTKQARVVAEEQGPLSSVESRLAKLSFDIFKVKGTKKRKHPSEAGLLASGQPAGSGSNFSDRCHSLHR